MRADLKVHVRFNHFGKIGRESHKRLGVVVKETTFLLVGGIKTNIVTQGIVDTGNYLNSWQAGFFDDLHGAAYSNVHYGPYQEYGTFRLQKRPHVVPAAEALEPFFHAQCAKAVA